MPSSCTWSAAAPSSSLASSMLAVVSGHTVVHCESVNARMTTLPRNWRNDIGWPNWLTSRKSGASAEPGVLPGSRSGLAAAARALSATRRAWPAASSHVGELARVAEFPDGCLGGRIVGEPGGAVRVDGVKEAAAELGHDVPAGPRRAWQHGGDLGQVRLYRLRRARLRRRSGGHDVTGRGAGSSRAVTAAENSRHVPRSASSMRRPAAVSW